jgi:hypothetical protein
LILIGQITCQNVKAIVKYVQEIKIMLEQTMQPNRTMGHEKDGVNEGGQRWLLSGGVK